MTSNEGGRTCRKCGESKPASGFYSVKGRPVSPCRECILRQQYAKRHGGSEDGYAPKGSVPPKWTREFRNARLRQYMKAYRVENKEKLAAMKRAYASDAKTQGILAYGGRCACCGESNAHFLTVDHISGRGDEPYRLSGKRLWQDLKRKGWPTDNYQLLCFNCNCAKGAYGQCPHLEANT